MYDTIPWQTVCRVGVPVDSLQKHIDFAPFIAKFGGGDVVRTDAFNSFYRTPGVQRAFDEATFESQGPVPRRQAPTSR